MNRIKTYIAGPMTGLPNFNKEAFAKEAEFLTSRGCDVVNPAALHDHTDRPWYFYMKAALKAMLDCEQVCMLQGWEESKGARLERQLALTLGMTVFYAFDALPSRGDND